jgi:hypothetical protein
MEERIKNTPHLRRISSSVHKELSGLTLEPEIIEIEHNFFLRSRHEYYNFINILQIQLSVCS